MNSVRPSTASDGGVQNVRCVVLELETAFSPAQRVAGEKKEAEHTGGLTEDLIRV